MKPIDAKANDLFVYLFWVENVYYLHLVWGVPILYDFPIGIIVIFLVLLMYLCTSCYFFKLHSSSIVTERFYDFWCYNPFSRGSYNGILFDLSVSGDRLVLAYKIRQLLYKETLAPSL